MTAQPSFQPQTNISFRTRLLKLLPYLVFGSLYSTLALTSAFVGRLTADEGFYAYAAQRVFSGELPYRDFLLPQTPLIVLVYGATLGPLGISLLGTRLLSCLFGLAAVLVFMRSCERLSNTTGAWIAGVLVAGNLSFVYDTSIFKTQALTVFLVGIALLSIPPRAPTYRHSIFAFSALATLTRFSMLPLMVFTLVCAFTKRYRILAIASTALIAAVLLLVLASGNNVWFCIYQFHEQYYRGLSPSVAGTMSFFINSVKNQSPVLLVGVAAIFVYRLGPAGLPKDTIAVLSISSLCWLLTTAIHATRVMPYATYQTSNLFLLAMPPVVLLSHFLETRRRRTRLFTVTVIIGIAISGMPFQEYPMRPWGNGTLASLDVAIHTIAETRIRGNMLTLNPELALESGHRLIGRYGMGQYSYFPQFDNNLASRRHVFNFDMFISDLENPDTQIVCLTHRDIFSVLAVGDIRVARKILFELSRRYTLRNTVSGFGQFNDVLMVYSR